MNELAIRCDERIKSQKRHTRPTTETGLCANSGVFKSPVAAISEIFFAVGGALGELCQLPRSANKNGPSVSVPGFNKINRPQQPSPKENTHQEKYGGLTKARTRGP